MNKILLKDLLRSGVENLLLDMTESRYKYKVQDIRDMISELGVEDQFKDIDWKYYEENQRSVITPVCIECEKIVLSTLDKAYEESCGRCCDCQQRLFPDNRLHERIIERI